MSRRSRSVSIYAENKEDYMKELLKLTQSKLGEKEFISNKTNYVKNLNIYKEEEDESENSSNSSNDEFQKLQINDNLEDDESEEQKILKETKKIDDSLFKVYTDKEYCNKFLCLYLKSSLNNSDNNILIFHKLNKNKKSLSYNDLLELNINKLANEVLEQDNDAYNITNNLSENKNKIFDDILLKNQIKFNNLRSASIQTFFEQNIKVDDRLKLMFISNNKNKFKGRVMINNYQISETYPFEITNKTIKLFNKTISLELFDISNIFLNNRTSTIYYQLTNSFIFLIDAAIENSKSFINKILDIINHYFFDKPIFILGFNILYKKDCTIDNFDLRKFSQKKNLFYYPLTLNDFNIKNKQIKQMLNIIMIKKVNKITNKRSSQQLNISPQIKNISKNLQKINGSSDMNTFNNTNCVGYKSSYRVKFYDAFDMKEIKVFHENKKIHKSGSHNNLNINSRLNKRKLSS